MAQFAIDELFTTGVQISGFIFDYSSRLGTPGQVLTSTSSGVMWQADSSNTDLATLSGQIVATGALLNNRINSLSGYVNESFISGSGIQNYVPRWNTAKELITGSIYDLGTGVGIGTTRPVSLLTVGAAGSTSAANGISFGGDVSSNIYRDSNASIRTDGGFLAASRIRTLDYIQFNTNLYPNAFTNYIDINIGNLAANNWQSAIRINPGGYVGVGTTQPSGKLHVVSTIAGETVLRADGTNGTLFSVTDDLSDSLMSVNNSAGLPVFEVFADDRIVGGQYGSGDFVLKNNKIGIGVLNPGEKLDVNGNVRIGLTTTNVIGTSNTFSLQTRAINIQPNSSTDTLYIRYLSDGNYQLQTATAGANGGNLHLQPYGGDVGIGITQPGGRLHISGSNGHVLYLNQGVTGAQGGLYFQNVDQFALSSARLYFISGDSILFTRGASNLAWAVSQNANVGIGVTNPSEKLTITGAVKILTRDGANFKVGDGSNNNTFLEFDYPDITTSDASFRIFRNTNTKGGKYFQIFKGDGTAVTQTLLNASGDSHINAVAGNVGVGTDGPNYKLDVIGTVRASGELISEGNNARISLFRLGGINYFDWASGQSLYFSTESSVGGAGRNTVMSITSGGNVGVGTVNALAPIHIGGNASNNDPWMLLDINDTYFKRIIFSEDRPAYGATGYGGYIGYDANNNMVSLGTYHNTGEFRSINIKRENGNVGIGTTVTPLKLNVSGSIYMAAGSGSAISWANDISSQFLKYDSVTDGMVLSSWAHTTFLTQQIERARITSNGNFGIGVTNPGVRLQVVNTGAITSTSTVRIVGATGNGGGSQIEFFKGASQKFSIGTASAITGGFSDDLLLATLNPSSIILAAGVSGFVSFKTDGKVGIGINNPISLLTIGGTGSTSPVSGITFGLDGQANLYRSAEGTVKTDGNLIVGTDLYVADELGVGVPIANKRFNYGAEIEVNSASIQLVLGRLGNATGQGAIGADSSNVFAVWNVSGGLSKPFVITQQGNIGIGVEPPSYKLEVNGNASFTKEVYFQNQSFAYFFGRTGFANKGTILFNNGSAQNLVFGEIANNIYSFGPGNSGAAPTSNTLTLDNANVNVGIGITNPSGKLHLTSMGFTDQATVADTNLFPNNTGVFGLVLDGGYTNGLYRHRFIKVDRSANLPLYLQQAGAVADQYLNLVRFGTHSQSTDTFEVFGSSKVNGSVNVTSTLLTSGNVGIGTAVPTYQLTVIGANQATANLTDAGVKGGSILVASSVNASNQGGAVLFATKNDVNLYTPQFAIKSLFQNGIGSGIGDLAFSSRLATGDASLTEVLRIKYDGKVGIGTTNPTQKLEVSGTVKIQSLGVYSDPTDNAAFLNYDTNGGIFTLSARSNGGNTYMAFRTSNGGTGSEKVRITNNGFVGISSNAPIDYLDFGGAGKNIVFGYAAYGEVLNSAASIIGNNVKASPTANSQVRRFANANDQGNFIKLIYNKGVTFHTNITSALNTDISEDTNERMRINLSGDVGIGTISPVSKLDVNGGISLSGYLFADRFSFYHRVWEPGGNPAFYLGDISDPTNYYDNNTHIFRTRGGGAERMRISSAGNVGIGTFSPSVRLHIENSGTVSSIATVRLVGSTGNNAGSQIEFYKAQNPKASIGLASAVTGGFSDDLLLLSSNPNSIILAAGSSGLAVFKPDGKVGIGVVNPISLLSVGGSNSTVAGSGISFGQDAQANLYRSAEDTIKTDGSLTVAGLVYNNNSAYYASVSEATTSNWGQYTIILGNSNYSNQLIQVTVDGGNVSWNGIFVANASNSYRPTELWGNVKLLEYSTYNCNVDDVVLNVMSNTAPNLYGGTSLVLKTNPSVNGGSGTGQANVITVTLTGPAAGSFGSFSNSWTSPYTYITSTSANTKQIYSNEAGRVGVGTTSPVQKFQIDGTVGNPASVGTTQSGIFRISNTTDNATLDFGLRPGGGGAWIQSTDETSLASNYNLLLNPNGGNVGIGTFSPSGRLSVDFAGISAFNVCDSFSSNVRVTIGTINTAGYTYGLLQSYQHNTNAAGGPFILQPLGGNIGIGTTVPTGLLNVARNSNTAQPIAFFREIYGSPAATNVLLLERGNNLSSVNQTSSNAGLRIRDHSINYSLSVEDHLSNVNFAISGAKVMLGSRGTSSLLNIGGAGSTAATSGITFGEDSVVNLYRLSASVLKTDAAFTAASLSSSSYVYAASYLQTAGGQLYAGAPYGTLTVYVGNIAQNAWESALYIGRGSYVGIGTVQPSGKLHVVSTVAGETVLRADGTNGTLFSVTDDLSDSLMSVNNSAGLPIFEVFADDRIVAGQYASGDFVLRNNKVGIGTTNPNNKLSVIGAASIGGAGYNIIAPNNGLIVEGNVGIGTTNPVELLDLYGSASRIKFHRGGAYDMSFGMHNSTFSALSIKNASDASTVAYFQYDGKVGIGTTVPTGSLNIVGANTAGLLNLYATSFPGNVLRLNSNFAGGNYVDLNPFISSVSNGGFEINLNGTRRLVIEQNGSVGIGTTNPSIYNASIIAATGNSWFQSGLGVFACVGIGEDFPNITATSLMLGPSNTRTSQIGKYAAGIGFNNLLNYSTPGNMTYAQSPHAWIGLRTDTFPGYETCALAFATRLATDGSANSTVERMCLTPSGNVGIGTTNPSSKLEVYSATKTSTFVGLSISNYNDYDGTAASLVKSQLRFAILENPPSTYSASNRTFATCEAGNEADNSSSNGFFSISTRTNAVVTEKFRITSVGNVGVGVTNPVALLSIGGTGSTLAASGLAFGQDAQANLYRSAEDTIKTDGSLIVNGNFNTNSTTVTNLNINAGTLNGIPAGSTITGFTYAVNNGNVSQLNLVETRFATGSDWTTASTKIQKRVDVTNQAYIEFNPSGSAYGMAFGVGVFGATEAMRIASNGTIGIGITSTSYKLQVLGSFAATTKSFDITHPTISGKRLTYASLEGPENGVYFRGKNNNNEIDLPHYWSGLVHDDSITVNLTSIGKRKDGRIRNYSVDQIGCNKVYIYTDSDDNIYDYYYTIFAERKDVSKLVIERDME